MTARKEEQTWDGKITQVERNLNIAVNKSINKSTFECLHGYLPEFGDGRLTEIV